MQKLYTPRPSTCCTKTVFGCRKVFSPSVFIVILNLVNQLRRMLQPDSDSQSFRLDLHPVPVQPAIYVACRMSGSQDDRSAERLSVVGLNAHYPVIFNNQPVHACLEMHFSSTVQDGISHVLNDPRKLVGTDMRMCVRQDGRTGSVLTEYVQDFSTLPRFLLRV